MADAAKLLSDKTIINEHNTAKAESDRATLDHTNAQGRSAAAQAGITEFENKMETHCKTGFTAKVLSTANQQFIT